MVIQQRLGKINYSINGVGIIEQPSVKKKTKVGSLFGLKTK